MGPQTRRTCLRAIATLCIALAPALSAEAEPWRADAALGLPDRLTLEIEHRTRFEHLDGQFRTGRTGEDSLLLFRTLVHGRLRVTDWLTLGGEFQDSRVALDETNSALNTSLVNAAELLQAYAEVQHPNVLGGELRLRGGRLTFNVGGRRLVSRNRFRNTVNSFTGAELEWSQPGGRTVQAFYTLPINRLPSNASDLRDNSVRFDKETSGVQLWGVLHREPLAWDTAAEIYIVGLHERDSIERPTRNRDLYTPGLRLLRRPKPGRVDFELESILQAGESRATRSSPLDLSHFAHTHHLELGYTFDCWAFPRAIVEYDYASGDRRPTDGRNGRFDPLFGSRGFDFGPTSSYGAFARSNVNSPALGVEARPLTGLKTTARVRGVWLASERDAWTTAGVVDPSGVTNRYVGTQLELLFRWQLLPGNLQLDAGVAHLFAGAFIDNAPNSNRQGDSTYLFSQATLRF